MKIGIIDIISNQSVSLYAKWFQSSLVSIMPQAIGVWCEELSQDVWYHILIESDITQLNTDLDLVFISTHTCNAYLAYCVSNYYKFYEIITVVGGPHAVSYPDECLEYFDIVVNKCDKSLIAEILGNPQSFYNEIVSSEHPEIFPGIKDRWKFIKQNFGNKCLSAYGRFIPALSSIGCPFNCNFCSDADTSYQFFGTEVLEADFKFLAGKRGNFNILWYDPNFGINLNHFFNTFHTNVYSNISHLAEMNLSFLNESVLIKLKENRFWGLAPGLESWSSYDNKVISTSLSKKGKVIQTAEHLKLITKYVPFIQLNIIFGLDIDTEKNPSEAFELTKEFMWLVPNVSTNFQTLTIFGKTSKLGRELYKADRVIDVPYHVLDGFTISNVKFKCDNAEFYNAYIDLIKFTKSRSFFIKRLQSAKDWRLKLLFLGKQFNNQTDLQQFNRLTQKKSNTFEEYFYQHVSTLKNYAPISLVQKFKR